MLMQAFILLATLCANNNVTMCLTVFTLCNTVVSRKYAPPPPLPFATLASVQDPGWAYMWDATIFFAITPSLLVPVKHDLIVGWGLGAKREVLPTLPIG